MQNDYTPEVIVKACYSDNYIYLYFNVYEQKVTTRYLNVGDPVFKDNCVELFINLFPKETEEYFNIELNAIGTIKMGYGIKRYRSYLTAFDLKDMKVVTSIKKPIIGFYGTDHWELYCAIPIRLLEKFSNRKLKVMRLSVIFINVEMKQNLNIMECGICSIAPNQISICLNIM